MVGWIKRLFGEPKHTLNGPHSASEARRIAERATKELENRIRCVQLDEALETIEGLALMGKHSTLFTARTSGLLSEQCVDSLRALGYKVKWNKGIDYNHHEVSW